MIRRKIRRDDGKIKLTRMADNLKIREKRVLHTVQIVKEGYKHEKKGEALEKSFYQKKQKKKRAASGGGGVRATEKNSRTTLKWSEKFVNFSPGSIRTRASPKGRRFARRERAKKLSKKIVFSCFHRRRVSRKKPGEKRNGKFTRKRDRTRLKASKGKRGEVVGAWSRAARAPEWGRETERGTPANGGREKEKEATRGEKKLWVPISRIVQALSENSRIKRIKKNKLAIKKKERGRIDIHPRLDLRVRQVSWTTGKEKKNRFHIH